MLNLKRWVLVVLIGTGVCSTNGAAAWAKACSEDEIVTLAKQGFTKTDISRLCDNAGAGASEPMAPVERLIEVALKVGKRQEVLPGILDGLKDLGWVLMGNDPIRYQSLMPGGWRVWVNDTIDALGINADYQDAKLSRQTVAECDRVRAAFERNVGEMSSPLALKEDLGAGMNFKGTANNGADVYLSCVQGVPNDPASTSFINLSFSWK